jgi:hypothetical protein
MWTLMTLKRLFIVVAGIAAGVIFAIACVVAIGAWWNARPVPRDTESVVAVYDGAHVRNASGTKRVDLRYTFENTTDKDIHLYGGELTTYVRRREDGSLFDVKDYLDKVQNGIDIPAGEKVVWLLIAGIGYSETEYCKGFALEDVPTNTHAQEFMDACYPWIAGFRLQTRPDKNMLVELPAPKKVNASPGE